MAGGREGGVQDALGRVSLELGGEAALEQPCQVSTGKNICEGVVNMFQMWV